jgi:hypothetical protein
LRYRISSSSKQDLDKSLYWQKVFKKAAAQRQEMRGHILELAKNTNG